MSRYGTRDGQRVRDGCGRKEDGGEDLRDDSRRVGLYRIQRFGLFVYCGVVCGYVLSGMTPLSADTFVPVFVNLPVVSACSINSIVGGGVVYTGGQGDPNCRNFDPNLGVFGSRDQSDSYLRLEDAPVRYDQKPSEGSLSLSTDLHFDLRDSDQYETRLTFNPFDVGISIRATVRGTGTAQFISRQPVQDSGSGVPIYYSFAFPEFQLGQDTVVAIARVWSYGGTITSGTSTFGGFATDDFLIRALQPDEVQPVMLARLFSFGPEALVEIPEPASFGTVLGGLALLVILLDYYRPYAARRKR